MKINIENNQQIVAHDKGFSKNRVTQFAKGFAGAALSTLKIFVLKIQGRSK